MSISKVKPTPKPVPTPTPKTVVQPQGKAAMNLATQKAVQAGIHPDLLAAAKSQLGAAEYIGFCEAFVEQAQYGKQGIFPSAIAAWQQQKGVPGLNGIKPGDAVYFGPENTPGGNGHTGIYAGNGEFISATDTGIQQLPLNEWQQATGQKLLGYVPNTGKVPTSFNWNSPQGPVMPTAVAMAQGASQSPESQIDTSGLDALMKQQQQARDNQMAQINLQMTQNAHPQASAVSPTNIGAPVKAETSAQGPDAYSGSGLASANQQGSTANQQIARTRTPSSMLGYLTGGQANG